MVIVLIIAQRRLETTPFTALCLASLDSRPIKHLLIQLDMANHPRPRRLTTKFLCSEKITLLNLW